MKCTTQLRRIKRSFAIILLCISMVIPQVSVFADVNDGNPVIAEGELKTPEVSGETGTLETSETPETPETSGETVTPATPATPGVSGEPATSGVSGETVPPEAPEGTETPVTPETPAGTDTPVTPETPAGTDTPVTPETPAGTVTPATPETPAGAETPVTPETPAGTVTSATPEVPAGTEKTVVPEVPEGNIVPESAGMVKGMKMKAMNITEESVQDLAMMPMLFSSGPDPDLGEEPDSGEHGSGSYQLNEDPEHYRFYTEYYVDARSDKSYQTATVDRRTTIKVYAKEGEYILFGSSVANSEIDENNKYTKQITGKDIVITKPDKTTKESFDVLLPDDSHKYGVGYIANPTQEKNGPMVNHKDENSSGKYYTPLTYEVPEGGSGIYTIEFHSQKGYNDGTTQTPSLAKEEDWKQGPNTVAAWDVTVLGKESDDKWEVKVGRAWADYLALTTGGGESKHQSDLDVHVLTHDGYIYKVDFSKTVPNGFIFFANNTGFMTLVDDENDEDNSGAEKKPSYRPIYHSFYDSTNDLANMTSNENIYLHKPNEDDTDKLETYKIFFNAPNQDLNGVEGIKTDPGEKVNLDNLKFKGFNDNMARAGHGGHFTFTSSGEAMVTIRLDLRKAILDSEGTMDAYEGSGIVEITAPAVEGDNNFYWDGKDTEGNTLPAGIYGNNNVILSSEVKRGELHFPIIDMEGLYGGFKVKRLESSSTVSDEHGSYDLYYNNNPLAYGTIEGKDYTRKTVSNYDILTDGTKSYKMSNALNYFSKYKSSNITTLVKDDKEYLAKKFFGKSYSELEDEKKTIIDAEFGKEQDTFHFEPVNSSETSMKFDCGKNVGGGNQAGIDAWTYYSESVKADLISFALMDNVDRGLIRGQIFYDADKNSKYEEGTGDYFLPNVKVRLIDSTGKPLVHEESLPCFDATGHFIYNDDGTVKHKEQDVEYEAVTDASGNYRFTGVPYTNEANPQYYVQVMLSDVQSEVLRYACTTSEKLKSALVTKEGEYFHNNDIASLYGTDGNGIVYVDYKTKIYGYKYDRDTKTNELKFDIGNAQPVSFSADSPVNENNIRVAEFKQIGYCTAVPEANRKDYKVKKVWGEGTHEISDGLIVELWVWNDSAVEEENALELSRRTGALMDTQVLNEENHWEYTWKNLDDRLQYYVLEYYTKKKPNGEIIYNDRHEPRKVLIGGTMPIFSTVPASNTGIYGFKTNLGDYPEKNSDGRIPIQKFVAGESSEHHNSITRKEKLESVDNNARQYDVKYTLSVSADSKTNEILLTNSQVYDDRTYYVWLDHETELPNLVALTYVDEGVKNDHAVKLIKDEQLENGEYTIKGLSVSSVDAAESKNTEGNATAAFRIKGAGEETGVLFTATNHGNYKTGTGTRTYQVKYVVDSTYKQPVSVMPNETGKLVLSDNKDVVVESNPSYIVYTWYMTIHVYDVQPDGVIEYDPKGGDVSLQKALDHGYELEWELIHNGTNSITYKAKNDNRTSGILHNDIYRLPLYKAAENPHMGSCADLVGIAYVEDPAATDISKLVFEDTYASRYGAFSENEDGTAIAKGKGGNLTVELNTLRSNRINRIQDHANYDDVYFTPNGNDQSEDVFYYKIIVFAEDSTYQYSDYEDIDATEGVVMYTNFTMKPKKSTPPGEDPKPDDPGNKPGEDPKPDDPGNKPGEDPGNKPGEDPGNKPGEDPGNKPGEDPGNKPGEDPGNKPGEDPGNKPGEDPGNKPGEDPGNKPGENPFVPPVIAMDDDDDDEPSFSTNDEPNDGAFVVLNSDMTKQAITVVKPDETVKKRGRKGVISPKTSDNSHILLWISLECFGVALVIAGIYLLKRDRARK